ncbi:unnamed protein product [Sphagnum troendelagicum]
MVNDQESVISPVPAIRRICVNKTSRSKTLHLPNVNSEALEHDATVASKSASSETLEVDIGKMSLYDSVVNE